MLSRKRSPPSNVIDLVSPSPSPSSSSSSLSSLSLSPPSPPVLAPNPLPVAAIVATTLHRKKRPRLSIKNPRTHKQTATTHPNPVTMTTTTDDPLPLSHFANTGIAVFRVADPALLESQFDQSLTRQPEIQGIEPPYVGGGFSAFGHASSFHDVFVRWLRLFVANILSDPAQQFVSQFPPNYSMFETLFDRQALRPAGHVPTAESWHRDFSPTSGNAHVRADTSDIILGGWVNCNQHHSQYFTCIPGSHLDVPDDTTDSMSHGFKVINTKEELEQCKQRQRVIAIPPGHAIVFVQQVLHCITAKKLAFDMKRVYIGYRLADQSTRSALFTHLATHLERGDVISLKSGQMPRMYPILWGVNWQDKLIELSSKFTFPGMTSSQRMTGKRMQKLGLPEIEYPILNAIAPSVPPRHAYFANELVCYHPHPITHEYRMNLLRILMHFELILDV